MNKAKALAAKRHTTLKAVIESSIREALKAEQQAGKFTLDDRSVAGKGLQKAFRDRPWSGIRATAYEGRGN